VKKGEIKKQEILATAEELFCKKGYETTSIQDILDQLNTSKGSFYHHYASKEILLEAICYHRAEVLAQSIILTMNDCVPPMENLNTLLSGMIPLTGEKFDFLMMILPVFDLPEGRQIRFSYAESLAGCFREAVIKELRRGNDSGELYCTDIGYTADFVFLIINELWYRIFLMIIQSEKAGRNIDYAEILRMIYACRISMERMISAPFGSIRLLELDDLKELTEQIRVQLKKIDIIKGGTNK